MSWIPVYSIGNCKTALNDATKSEWFKKGITHIALQFWVPGDNGDVVFVTDYKYTYKASTISQDVKDFVSWGDANNVKVMLCFHNVRNSDFDWTYAQQVINNYPNETVASIMTIINNYGLSGVDIDFEGIGDFDNDKSAYVSFLDTLGKALHASGKELSVDMFPTPCYNAPNPSWESAIAPYVDFMNIMGYADTYEDENTLFSSCPQTPSENNTYPFRYSYIENYLTTKQGVLSSKLNYGIPGWVDTWGGKCIHENLIDIMKISSNGGIAIWDLDFSGTYWSDPVTWDIIAMFKNDSMSSQIRSNVLVCGVATAIVSTKEIASHIHYDSYNQIIKLSGTEGELYLYSVTGVLENFWKVNGSECISVGDGIVNGFYIIKYRTRNGIYSERVCIYK